MSRAALAVVMAARARDTPTAAPPDLVLLSGSAHPTLGADVAHELGLRLGGCRTERFPDGETHVEVDARAVDGRDVIVLQPTSNPATDHLLELLFIADACRRAGAATVSALIPYFGYARQDRRKLPGEALGARVIADVLATARLERIVAVDLHSDVVEASLDVPVEHLTAVPLLAEALERQLDRDAVVVAPDFGAVKLAREYARRLSLPIAVVHKVRMSGTEVAVERIAGDVRGLHPIIVDDMIATGGTIVAAARVLRNEGSAAAIIVAATHAVLAPHATNRLREAGVRKLVVTNTIAELTPEPDRTVVSVAPLLAGAVRRLAMRRLGPGG